MAQLLRSKGLNSRTSNFRFRTIFSETTDTFVEFDVLILLGQRFSNINKPDSMHNFIDLAIKLYINFN